MEEQLISFNTAKLAKEKGFDIPCENFYVEYIDDDVDLFNYEEQRGSGYAELYRNNTEFKFSAPTQSLLQKWLREVHNIHIQITTDDGLEFGMCLNIIDNPDESGYWIYFIKTYEKTLEVGLYEALKLITILKPYNHGKL